MNKHKSLELSEYEFADYLRKKDYQPSFSNIQEIIYKEAWRDIHQKFNYQLRKKWEDKNFDREQTKSWIIAGIKPESVDHVQKWKDENFTAEQTRELTEIGFSPYDLSEVLGWKVLNFTIEQIKEWVSSGTKLDDYEFVAWLKKVKNYEPEWISTYREDYEILSGRFKKYDVCSECNQPNTGEQWCKDCNSERLQKNFKNWTSQNPQIDKFIQKYQLKATEANKFLEWIPYKQFRKIEHIANGGFGKVYKARWIKGSVEKWEKKIFFKDSWKRKGEQEVVLKSLNNSSTGAEFLQEVEKHKLIDDWFNNIVPCYGLSQDPQTKNYLIVMQYIPEGNLRHYLSKNNWELTLKDKISQLHTITQGLKDIHAKNLVHRDFHSGNILKGIKKTSCLITDLGLCKPVDEVSQEKRIFGVMPYVSPEVLRSQPYTQKADIYSFGIIAYEVLSGLPPYYDKKHDEFLGLQICQGLRPQFQIKIPQLLEGLIKRCWDADPTKRPTAQELERIFRNWEQDKEEFQKQLQEAEEFNKTLPEEVKFPKYEFHYGACYHSKLLPTKEITKLLSKIEIDLFLIDDETKELSRKFVRARKEMLKGDKAEKNKVKELEKKLEAKGLSEEKIEEIIREAENEQQEIEMEAKIQQTNFMPFNKNS